MNAGIPFTDNESGETGWLIPVGWTPTIALKIKPLTTPDLDRQAGKAEPREGGRRGHIVVQGIPIAIENPVGSIRSGVDSCGTKWSVKMANHYGFCKRSFGADGDGVDCFVGPNPESQSVFIVNQVDPLSGEFDEHKVMIGWDTEAEAKAAYFANYSKGWDGFHSIAAHTIDDFKDWLADENATRTIAKSEAEGLQLWDPDMPNSGHGWIFPRPDGCKARCGGPKPPDYQGDGLNCCHCAEDQRRRDGWRTIVKGGDPIPAGAHWITAHPDGPGSKGHPLLIQPIQGSNGAARVIGGAQGKLNGLRLHGLKNPAQYKEESRANAKGRREAEAKRKASLSPDDLAKEREVSDGARAERKQAEDKFINDVLVTATGGQGGDHEDLFKGEDDPKVAKEAHRARLAEAKKIVAEAEKKVLLDAEARGASGINLVGGDSPMDLDAILSETQGKSGPGYNQKLAERAEKAGMTSEKLMAAVNEIQAAEGKAPKEATGPKSPEEQAANIQIHKATKDLQAQKAAAMRDAVKESLESNETLAHLLRARQALRATYKQQMAAKKGITFEPGFQMAVGTPEEHEALVQSLHEQLLTQHVQGFLEEVGERFPEGSDIDPFKTGEMEGMHQSRGAGAFDLLHDVGLAALGQGMIDRDVVECLGPEGAAHVVARALRQNFSPEDQQAVLEALEHHHLQEQETLLPQVTEDAQALRAKAAQCDQELLEVAHDIPAAVEIQKNKVEALKEARRVLGGALGRLEARAALIAALHSTPLNEYQIPLGKMTPEKAVMTAAALGMPEGSYQISHEDGEAVITAQGAAMDAMVKPVDCAALGEREVALSLKGGQQDEDNWIPAGFANRLADRYSNPEMEPAEFQRHHDIQDGDDAEAVKGKLQAWMGSRLADGERPEDIVASVYGGAKLDLSPEAQAHWDAAMNEMVPLRVVEKDAKSQPIQEKDKETGKPIEINGKPMLKTRVRAPHEIAADLDPMMQGYMAANPNEAGTTLQGQRVQDDGNFHEALHRALAKDPRLAAAYIPQGELTHEHASAIRDFFYKEHFGGKANSDDAKKWKFDQAIGNLGPEPEKTNAEVQSMNLFAGMSDDDAADAEGAASDKWVEWNNKRQQLESEYHEDATKPTLWDSYIQRMGGTKFAQGAIQDVMRGQLNEAFHDHYHHLTGQKLQMATADISGAQAHLQMTLGDKEAEALAADRKSQQAKLQKKGGGQFGAGKVGDKLKEAKAAQALAKVQDGALFNLNETEEPEPGREEAPAAAWEKPELAPGERYHLGTALENQIRGLMPAASAPFAGRKGSVNVQDGLHMSGKYVQQQRAVKAITQLKRMGLFYGAGSGKTPIMLGSLTTLHQQGKLKKGIIAVPSVVQAQFGAEAIRFIDPSSGFHVHAAPGESYDERLAAYRDPDQQAVVVTHQTLRDDTLKILGDHLGSGPEGAREFLHSASPKDAAASVKEAFIKAGIDFNAMMVDEAHGALDRDGKEDSTWSKVLDAHSYNSEHVVMATGDPLKNDVSEVWSNLNKIDPHKYPPESKDEFMRRYKNDAPLAKKSMAQELARYWFNGRVDPGKECYKSNPSVALTDKQHQAVDQVELASGKLRTGAPDTVKWAKMLAPKSFDGKPEADHQAIAEKVRKAVGTMRESAMNRIINLDPEGGKMAEHVRIAKERIAEGKPVVIFSHNLEAVASIQAAMEKAGIKATSLTGKDSSKDKAAKAARFDSGQADVIVMSDAGATGLNLQHGKCIIHHDIPSTAMVHNQRTARIWRLGQKDNVESITLQADHPWEKNNMERIKRKGVLGEIFQDPNGFQDDSGLAGDLKAVRARAGQANPAAA